MTKSEIFGSKPTEVMGVIVLGIKNSQTDICGFCRGKSDLDLHCFRMFVFVYRCPKRKIS